MDEFLTEAEFLALPETGTLDPHRNKVGIATINPIKLVINSFILIKAHHRQVC